MKTTRADELSLEVKRFIKAPRDRVYAAWVDPAQLKQWFGPENVQTHDLVADVRVGGKYRWDITNAEGEKMTVRGEYRELQPGRKIVFTWQWDDDEVWKNRTSIVTVELDDAEGGTELRLTHVQLPSEQSRDRHIEGWESVLERLEKLFSR
ncbi:MAG: SRPBCC domain-containing protein [Candidatus Acidiferrum sp.]